MNRTCVRATSIKESIEALFEVIAPMEGLDGWAFEWSTAGGYCWLEKRLIQLRDVENDDHATYWEVAGCLLHEIAHALAKPVHGSQHTEEFHDLMRSLSIRWHGAVDRYEVVDVV